MNLPTPPMILLASDGFFEVLDAAEPSLRLNWRAVRRDFLKHVQLFDVAGKLWTLSAENCRAQWGFWARLLNSARDVPVRYELVGEVSVAEMAGRLCEIIENDPDDLWDQWMSHDEVIDRISAAQSPGELIWFAGDLGAEEFEQRIRSEE